MVRRSLRAPVKVSSTPTSTPVNSVTCHWGTVLVGTDRA
jgi:hypothetical protein